MSLKYFDCHHCGAGIAVAPVFAEHHGRRYEAVATFSFVEGVTGKRRLRRVEAGSAGGCRILLDGKEFPNPTSAAKQIVESSINGWRFWKYKSLGGMITLDELAAGL